MENNYILEVSPLRDATGIIGYGAFFRNIGGHDPHTHPSVCPNCHGWTGWLESFPGGGRGTTFATEAEATEVGNRLIQNCN